MSPKLTPRSELDAPEVLGVRVTLHPDEWLQSAISRWAFQLGVSRRDLLQFFGLEALTTQEIYSIGTRPRNDVLANISLSTGVPVAALAEASMNVYNGRALIISTEDDLETRAISRKTPFSKASGSRFCPACLEEEPSVMRHAWRLNWTFVCVRHRMVLYDNCPDCHRPVREMQYGNLDIFDPARCRQPAGERGKNRYCDQRLADVAECETLASGSPLVRAQMLVNERLRGLDSLGYLAHLRAFIAALRATGSTAQLASMAGCDESELLGIIEPEEHPGASAPANALSMAVLTTAATLVAQSPEPEQAELLRRVSFDRVVTQSVSAPQLGPGSAADVLSLYPGAVRYPETRQLILRAHDEDLSLAQRLLWGTSAPASVRERYAHLGTDQSPYQDWIMRNAPAGFWSAWAVRLDATGRNTDHAFDLGLRRALQYADIWEAHDPGTNRPPARGISRTLRPAMLGTDAQIKQLISALIQLRLELRETPSPIDYRRRRSLPQHVFLPNEHWNRIAESIHLNPGFGRRGVCARRYLYERVTTSGERNKYWTPGYQVPTATYTSFLLTMTAELQTQLDTYAQSLLRLFAIGREPVTWTPPLLPLARGCPGRELADIDVARLWEMIGNGEQRQSRLTAELGVTPRHLMAAIDAFPIRSDVSVGRLEWTSRDWDAEVRDGGRRLLDVPR
jgi:hypothetical protein